MMTCCECHKRNVFNNPFLENEPFLFFKILRRKGIALNKLLLNFGRIKPCRFTSMKFLECYIQILQILENYDICKNTKYLLLSPL